jgi:hypothetical protein
MKIKFSREIFEKLSHIDILENPSSGSHADVCTDSERET